LRANFHYEKGVSDDYELLKALDINPKLKI
jgi:hypothetical protein